MSKIKVDTIESSNQNVKLTPNGTGVVEVKGAGGADGTLKLTSSDGSNGVTIKSPPHSAGQSHTLVLPDNSPTQNDFLKVKSISGSGSTAVGQLEYAAIATPDVTQLNASNVTSGTMASARFPATIPATSAGLKLHNFQEIASGTQVNEIDVTGLEDNSTYLIIADSLWFSNNSSQGARIYLLKADGTRYTSYYLKFEVKRYSNWYSQPGGDSYQLFHNQNFQYYSFVATISTSAEHGWIQAQGLPPGQSDAFTQLYGSWTSSGIDNNTGSRIHGISINGNTWGGLNEGSKVYTYKYLES